ncbi:glycosyltransferase family 4 protein [Neobacillus sp. SM06]|uniref:glycosyltransferase family 4 protein n=1 Tax=Neobacillus sp. SM06 TaxID=3422492 RepID=UPI003D292B64
MTEACPQKRQDVESPNVKILMLTWEYPPNVVGGLSRHVHGLSKHLAMIGVEVHVVTAGNGGLPPYEYADGVHIHRVKPLKENDEQFLRWIAGLNVAIASEAAKLAAKINFKLIHAHDWLTGAAAMALKDVLGLPLLATIHATEYGRNAGIHNEMQRAIHEQEQHLLNMADHVIVCSEFMREELSLVFGLDKERISIIANGIDCIEALPEKEIAFPKWEGKKRIFSVGRVVSEKGFATLIEAAALVKQANEAIHFLIAGKGPMLETYRRQIMERNLQEYITFVGYISDEEKDAFYRQCDIAIFPSLYEPFGIVVLESMNHGKPTIASRVGGLQMILQHMETGLFIEPGDAAQLLEQIHFLLENPQKAQEIGLQGRKMVKSLYGWTRIATETKRVMEDLLLQQQINPNDEQLIRK